jgi:hypothetical protein
MEVTQWDGHNAEHRQLLNYKMFEMQKKLELAQEELETARGYSRIARNSVKISLRAVDDAKHNLKELWKEYQAIPKFNGFTTIKYDT